MKNLFTLFLSCLFAVSASAQYGQTVTIAFKGNGNSNMEVMIDGRSYYANNNSNYGRNSNNGKRNPNSTNIVLNNLQTGQHSIAVKASRNNSSRPGSVYRNDRPLYSSTFNVKQGYNLLIDVKQNGQVSYIERPSYNNGRRSDDRDNDWKRGRNNDSRNGRDDDWRNDGRSNRDDDRRNNNGGYNNGYQAMSETSFNQLLQNIRGKWFQSNKITATRDAFSNSSYYFSTYQVKQLLLLISDEESRLELAKLSYRNVVDKSYFSQLYDIFSNQASRDQLERFIRSNRY